MYAGDIKIFCYVLLSLNIVYVYSSPNFYNQQPTAESYASVTNGTNQKNVTNVGNVKQRIIRVVTQTKQTNANQVFYRVMQILMNPLRKVLSVPKINSVMRNVATCVVNGAVELITFYFPAPLIPVIASAAGMLFPFEPVLMLRDKLPVTSYRRAFLSALNSFLGSFDKYRLEDNFEYDPYMTQRFRRRMMNYGETEKPVFNEINDKTLN